MAPAYLGNENEIAEMQEEEGEESSPFLTHGQQSGVHAVVRSGFKAALGLVALLSCVAVAGMLTGGHRGASNQPHTFLGFDGLLQEVDTSDTDSSNATSNATNATETCPDGYVSTRLDMQNHDADIHEETASLEECAAKCNGDAECKGFEHNMAAQHCWVSRAGHHCTDMQHEDWISCVKGDSDACQGGSDGGTGNSTTNATNATGATSPETLPATETCPDGYTSTQLDMQNHDADMHEETASLGDCAAKCNDAEDCKGFEHNMAAQTCWVSRAGLHCSDQQQEGWISCVKGDSDACEDGGPQDQ